ncbi:hypothetical protein [Mesorhizobium sp. B2-3-10]|uniref:hypothetical protein n=1 Tax=Mesorhizobium sp. B2-3-10 TaxID=2589954 RepID=UPI0015E4776C|nr:hypothetical protein [Mesorhizobium sp. B2-3-10]
MTIYTTGTVSVSNGSAVVTGSGTAWAVALVNDGLFSSAGVSIPIASVTDDTHLTLAYAWPGTTTAGVAYAIDRANSDAASVVDLYDKLTRILVTLSLAGITPDASGSLTDRAAITLGVGDKGFLFLYAEVGFDLAFYRWSGTAWQGPFAVKGGVGPQGNPGIGSGGLGLPTPGAANKFAYYTGPNALALTDFTALARTLLASTSLSGLQAAVGVREVLTAARTYYVRADGNDGNNGLANSSGGAFLTVQKAINAAAMLDTSIYDVTIQIGAGTYDVGNIGLIAKPCVGGGSVIIVGDETTPSNIKLRTTGTLSGNVACLISQNLSTIYKVRGVRFESTATGNAFGLLAVGSSRVEFQNIDLGTGLLQHLRAEDGGLLVATGPYSVSGSTQAGGFHWAVVGGAVIRVQTKTVTFSGTLSFGTFALATTGSIMFVNGNTFAGSAGSVTGTRYLSDGNSIISTSGGGTTYLPGSTAGSETNGGRYV